MKSLLITWTDRSERLSLPAAKRHRPVAVITSRWNSHEQLRAAVVLLLCVLGAAPAIAQNAQTRGDAQLSSTPTPKRSVLVDIEEDKRQQGNNGQAGNRFELNAQTLDQWIFNGPAEMARQNYQTLIKLEIEQIDAVCGLSAEQKRMLELAGAGEQQQIRDTVALLHAAYAGRSYDQDKVGEIFQEIQSVQTQVQRQPLAPTSLVSKLLPTTLDEAQTKQFAAWTQQRQSARLRGQIDHAVAIVEQQVPLRASQRQALIELLESKIRAVAPVAEGMNRIEQQATAVLAQMNAIAPKAFQVFLEDVQWEAMQAVFLPHRSRLRLLEQQGLLIDPNEPPVNKEATR